MLLLQGSPPNTPVARELAIAVREHNLSKVWLSRLIEARVSGDVKHLLLVCQKHAGKKTEKIIY